MLNIIYISASSVLDNLSIGSFVDLPIGHLLKHLALKMHQRVCFIIALLEIFSRPFSLISGSIPSRVPHLFPSNWKIYKNKRPQTVRNDGPWPDLSAHLQTLCMATDACIRKKRKKWDLYFLLKNWENKIVKTEHIENGQYLNVGQVEKREKKNDKWVARERLQINISRKKTNRYVLLFRLLSGKMIIK